MDFLRLSGDGQSDRHLGEIGCQKILLPHITQVNLTIGQPVYSNPLKKSIS
jgi:hypothetical protein